MTGAPHLQAAPRGRGDRRRSRSCRWLDAGRSPTSAMRGSSARTRRFARRARMRRACIDRRKPALLADLRRLGRAVTLTLPSNRTKAGAGATFRRCRRSPRRRRAGGRPTTCPGSIAKRGATAALRRWRARRAQQLGHRDRPRHRVEPPARQPRRQVRLVAPPRPRSCAGRAGPDRPCLDRRGRSSRRRDRARCGRAGLDRRDLHRRRLEQPAHRHHARQERAADAQSPHPRRQPASSA